MEKDEILDIRRKYEKAIWKIFGETIMIIPDIHEAQIAYNDRVKPLYDALPPEVIATFTHWQRRK